MKSNALNGWDHLKLGALVRVSLRSGGDLVGHLVDAQIISNRAGYPATVLIALQEQEAPGPPATIPMDAISGIRPLREPEAPEEA